MHKGLRERGLAHTFSARRGGAWLLTALVRPGQISIGDIWDIEHSSSGDAYGASSSFAVRSAVGVTDILTPPYVFHE